MMVGIFIHGTLISRLSNQHEAFPADFLRDFRENPPSRIHGNEGTAVREEHLRLAQKQKTALLQRKMEPSEDSGLRFRVEVHERVAAGQQIDTGDGCVLDE